MPVAGVEPIGNELPASLVFTESPRDHSPALERVDTGRAMATAPQVPPADDVAAAAPIVAAPIVTAPPVLGHGGRTPDVRPDRPIVAPGGASPRSGAMTERPIAFPRPTRAQVAVTDAERASTQPGEATGAGPAGPSDNPLSTANVESPPVATTDGLAASISRAMPAAISTAPMTPESVSAPGPQAASGPAAQVAPALAMLATASRTGGVTISLHPAELGRVDIRLERARDGRTEVTLRAERPEALRLLTSERPMLEAALDRAGVAAGHRRIAFGPLDASAPPETPSSESRPDPSGGMPRPAGPHIVAPAPPDAIAAQARSYDSPPAPSAAGSSGGSIGGGPSGGPSGGQLGGHMSGQSGGQMGGQSPGHHATTPWSGGRSGGRADLAEPGSVPAASAGRLAGVDITA